MSAVLIDVIEEQLAGLSSELEDALAAATIETEIDLLGSPLSLKLEPKRVRTTTDGMEIAYSSTATAPQAACVAETDPLGSRATQSATPAVADNPPGTEVGVYASDEMVNQILYAVYRSGVLCQTIDENSDIELPITLDSSLLSVLGGPKYGALVPVRKPLTIKTRPLEPLYVVYGDGVSEKPLKAVIPDLRVELFTEIDHRQARAVGVRVSGEPGADVLFNGTTGEVSLDLELDGALEFTVMPDVLVAGSEQQVEEGLQGLVDTLVGSLIGDLLGGPLITLPSFEGIGLSSLDLFGAGAGGDWLFVDATVGTVTYGSEPGAGCDSGCGGTGGSGGCSSSSPAGLAAVFAGLAGLVVRRRRSDAPRA